MNQLNNKNDNIIKKIINKYTSNPKIELTINIIIIIILVLLIRIFKGPISISTDHSTLNYDISINTSKVDKFTVNEDYKKTLIPIFLYKEDYTSNEYNLHTNTYFTKEDNYQLNLDISKCYKNDNETDYLQDYDNKTKIDYDKNNFDLIIKSTDNNKITYQGKFTNNITKYLPNTGNYDFIIDGTVDNTDLKIEFSVNIFN